MIQSIYRFQAILLALMLLGGYLPSSMASTVSPARIEETALPSHEPALTDSISVVYPKAGTIFPPAITPPTIVWDDTTANHTAWIVKVVRQPDTSGGPESPITAVTVSETRWQPDADTWKTIQKVSTTDPVYIQIYGISNHKAQAAPVSATTFIRTSTDTLTAPVFYRDVPLPFIYAVKNPETIRWRLGFIDSDQPPPVMLENLPVCGNCHSFSADGRILGMDVDYANDKGSYAITSVASKTVLSRDRVITWSDFRRDDKELTFGLLSSVSPDGRYVISTVKDRSVFVPRDDLAYSQLFFPIKGILVVYDRVKKEFFPLSGADNPEYVQSNPSWSPDGKYVYFARARAVKLVGTENLKSVLLPRNLAQDFLNQRKGFQYDIYRIPFNDGKGGTAEPVPGASQNGMSNFFPRISPDGKWLVFTMAKNFMLLQPDSQLYIMPANGGTPRKMACNTANMNSWHSWSPDGHWLVFASKQRGAYTQMFITHVDANGMDAPPVLLENMVLPGRAINIPEFVNMDKGDMARIVPEFLDDHNYVRQGEELADFHGDHKGAIRYFEKALELNPSNAKALVGLGNALVMLGKLDEAREKFMAAVQADRENPDGLVRLARLALSTYQYQEADQRYRQILAKWPDHMEAIINHGLTLIYLGKLPDAEERFRQALQLEPKNGVAHVYLGRIMEKTDRLEEADQHYRAALVFSETGLIRDFVHIAKILMYRPQYQPQIIGMLQDLLRHNPKAGEAYLLLGKIYIHAGQIDKAIAAFESARGIKNCPAWVAAKIDELKKQQQVKR